ncbi:hypothetical protein [Streptomyces sp. DT117]|uniref:hypothetical protein n=1 Tax=Streptomyces sp. DT117 TaxID=3393422 RepID=UPI003CECB9CA
MFAQSDGTFVCKRGHTRDPRALDLPPDEVWLANERGELVRILTPAATLECLFAADREYLDAPAHCEAEHPPLVEIRDAVLDLVTAMELGMPYPAEVRR